MDAQMRKHIFFITGTLITFKRTISFLLLYSPLVRTILSANLFCRHPVIRPIYKELLNMLRMTRPMMGSHHYSLINILSCCGLRIYKVFLIIIPLGKVVIACRYEKRKHSYLSLWVNERISSSLCMISYMSFLNSLVHLNLLTKKSQSCE
jgi:hypothetical protein